MKQGAAYGSHAIDASAKIAGARAQRRNLRGFVAVLGCMAVFVIMAALMLPAISMTRGALVCDLEEHHHTAACYEKILVCDKDEDTREDGEGAHEHTSACYEKRLVCGKDEHEHSDACYEQEQPKEEPASAADGAHDASGDADDARSDSNLAGDAPGEDADKGADDASSESSDKNDADSGNADEPDVDGLAISASASSVGAVGSSSSGEMPAQSFAADLKDKHGNITLTVSVEAPEGAFPAGTFMKIDSVAANQIKDAVGEAVAKKADGKVMQIQAVDISFHEGGPKGVEIEPARDITVRLTSTLIAENDKPLVVHIDDKGKVDVVDTLTKKELKKRKLSAADDELLFDSNKFSTYGIVIATFEQTLTASDGNAYTVTVTAPAEAGVSESAELEVRELVEGSEEYEGYRQRAADALGSEPAYTRLFDISIVGADGAKIQPDAPVEVEIALDDADALGEGVKAVHFAEGTGAEILNASLAGDTVAFEASGFSVYAVVDGSTEVNARMKLEFYSGGNLIATMYVKNGDELLGAGPRDPYKQYIEDIVFDPGVGVLGTGEVFAGWILDNQNYTTADVDDAMTIEQIREWAASQQITEGVTTHRFDAAICKLYTITYKDEVGTVLGMDAVPVKSSETGTAQVTRTVNMAYSPKDDVHNFEGWKLDEDATSHVASTIPADRIYANGTSITINGDISFTVNAPAGNWLVFNENGKGGTYNAPQFVKAGETTVAPRPDAQMTRNGYTFGGWYDTKEHADAHGANPSVTTGEFIFGGEIGARTTLYASWIPNTSAPYTVILWGQNVDRTAYEVLGSYVNNNGTVGQNIPYTVVENQDEDYVTGVGSNNGHYTGFTIKDADKNQQVTITPEGDAVLNLHFDRIEYNLRFYLYRDSGSGNNRYSYANNSANGNNVWGIVNWHTSGTNHPTADYTIQHERVEGYEAYYFVLNAYYGEDISTKWPEYGKIHGVGNNQPVSYVMMVGTQLKPRPSAGGDGTVKGLITTLDNKILGATNNSNGNFLIIRFPGNSNNWRYHVWYETVEGEDYTGKTTRTYNGKTYYEDTVIESRSSNTDVNQQNAPQYTGFEYVGRRNQNWNGDGSWSTNNPTLYHINYLYDRMAYEVSYFDGCYVNGNGDLIQNRATHLLNESEAINHGAIVPDADRNYVPTLPEGEEGYVFEGWYLDEGCTTPYTWSAMPIGGIKVYAKWRQVQYRVFLHPNASTDPSLDWGADNVSTSFRVSYGEKVSTPTGKREDSGYEFVGWYTDQSMTSAFLYNSDTVLNDETVTTPYDKTEDTERDKWGNPTATGNNDADRFWITKKLDLYAKWRKILDGAGINVVYTADDGKGHVGANAPVDPVTYPDKAEATAQAADTPPSGMYFKCWVIQTWDEDANDGQGGYVDTDLTVVPGEQFTVDEQYARKEPIPGTTEHEYTMQLRAEYEQPGEGLQTHIWWFDNYSDDNAARHNSSRQDEGIQVNEAKQIKAAPTREGYEFLGWARVPRTTSESVEGNPPTGLVLDLTESDLYLAYDKQNDEFTLNDSTSEDNGSVVTQIAADEKLDYHDMYAVWKKKTYTVTVIKETPSVSYQDTPFEFTPAGFPASVEGGGTPFWLVGNPEGTTVSGTTYQHEKVFESVPFGTEFSITETANTDFDVSVKYSCTGADDTAKNVDNASSTNGGQITVNGNITVTFTNARKATLIKIVKTDQSGTALANATFTSDLFAGTVTTQVTGTGADAQAVILDTTNVALGDYTLNETEAPAGYLALEGPVTISVAEGQAAGDVVVTAKINGEDSAFAVVERVDTSHPELGWIITVKNNAGVALPSTGGVGTPPFHVLGAILIACAAICLLPRTRRYNWGQSPTV